MRHFLFIIITLLVPNFHLAQQHYIKINLEETEYLYPAEKVFLKKTGQPLNGSYELKFNRYQYELSTFTDGLKNGETRTYRNKKLAEIGTYQNDLREGDWNFYYSNGDLWKITTYQNGLRHGIERIYSNGKVIQTNIYKANHKIMTK